MRKKLAKEFDMPACKIFETYKKGSGKKELTTTSAFVQILSKLLKDEKTCL